MKADEIFFRMTRACLLLLTVVMPGSAALAALNINSVLLDGASFVMVPPGASITATVNETNTGGSNWRSTRYTFNPGGTSVCSNHSNGHCMSRCHPV